MQMVWAHGVFTGGLAGNTGIAYHGNNKAQWTLTIPQDGKATSGGKNGITDTGGSDANKPMKLHGWLMVSAWSVLAVI